LGLFSAPQRFARHVTIPRAPGLDRYVQAWRWFVNSRAATFVALLVSILALLGGLLVSSRFGI
jgi:hypothetical protein